MPSSRLNDFNEYQYTIDQFRSKSHSVLKPCADHIFDYFGVNEKNSSWFAVNSNNSHYYS